MQIQTRYWTLRPQVAPSDELRHATGENEFIATLLARRGIVDAQAARAYLDPDHYTPAPPHALIGLAHAAELLYTAINRRRRILVWGDFDVDGQTSTALLVAALRRLSDTDRSLGEHDDDSAVAFHIPNRFSEGHGIEPERLVQKLAEASPPFDLLITCDTGIDEGPAIALAKDQGLTVIITDHHDLGPELTQLNPAVDSLCGQTPPHVDGQSVRRADAIINPKLQPPDDPLRSLPGVGVAFKLIQALYALCDRAGEEEELLDLVALGIVADVAEQVADARYLLQKGLAQLRKTRRTGLLALMELARITPANITATDIGFQIGPRMNALGRLEDATVAVELLTTRDAIRAGQLAARMERLNQERRLLTTQITATAFEMLARNPGLLDFNALVLAHPAWHAGIVGIVASRLVEEYQKPVVLLLNPPDGPARGSARSVPDVDIGAAIAGCSHLLLSHGGHPGAAGVGLLHENIDRFRRELSRQVDLHRIEDAPMGLMIDGELALDEIDLTLAEDIQRLAPFGQGNPTPYFLGRNLQIQSDRLIGRDGSHRRLAVTNPTGSPNGDGTTQTVMWFNGGDAELPPPPIDLVFSVEINEFRGERSVQLHYVDSRSHTGQPKTTSFDADWIDQAETTDATEVDTHISGEPPTTGEPDPGSAGSHTAEAGPASPPPDRGVQRFGKTELFDLRHGDLKIAELPPADQAIWYAEGTRLGAHVAFAPRSENLRAKKQHPDVASRSDTLVIWTPPPTHSLLAALLRPENFNDKTLRRLYLCGVGEVDDRLESTLQNVAGMCKFALARDGKLDIGRMAARLGLTESLVRRALLWLERNGVIHIIDWNSSFEARIEPGSTGTTESTGATQTADNTPKDAEAQILRAELEAGLAEIRAYRRHFRRATLHQLGLASILESRTPEAGT